VAILDWDVHHGNGTEACLVNLAPNLVEEKRETAFGEAVLRQWSFKPWATDSDRDNVFFASLHGYGCEDPTGSPRWFYPGSGGRNLPELPSHMINVPLPRGYSSLQFRPAFAKVVAAMAEFAPDMVFISAGFDAHGLDDLNMGYAKLTEADYAWATEQVVLVANKTAKGRIVSVLEGGYRLKGGPSSAFGGSVRAHIRGLARHQPCVWSSSAALADAVTASLEKRDEDEARAREAARAQREQAAAAATAEEPAGEESGRGGRRKRAKVDYVALAAKLAEEGKLAD